MNYESLIDDIVRSSRVSF